MFRSASALIGADDASISFCEPGQGDETAFKQAAALMGSTQLTLAMEIASTNKTGRKRSDADA